LTAGQKICIENFDEETLSWKTEKWGENIKPELRKIGCEDETWMHLTEDYVLQYMVLAMSEISGSTSVPLYSELAVSINERLLNSLKNIKVKLSRNRP
jgi:hypothetical protein